MMVVVMVTTNSYQKNDLPLLICENETYLFVHFTSWLIYSTYRRCHGFDSEPLAKCTSSVRTAAHFHACLHFL
jgi:hypothetical protein